MMATLSPTFRPEAGDKVSLLTTGFMISQKIKMAFMDFHYTELYSCYDLQRARFVDYTGCGELRQNYSLLYLLQPTETYGYHIKAMVADVWCIRKTVK